MVAQTIRTYPPGTNPTCCFKHEKNFTGLGVCPPLTCQAAILFKTTPPFCPAFKQNVDYCACDGPDRFYNNCSQCVPFEDCNKVCELPPEPQCNGPNAVLVECLKPKEYNMCESLKSPFATFIRSNINSTDCIPNVCNCVVGYLRNANGVCVPKCKCDEICKEKECPGPYEELVKSECECIRGFERNKSFQCVPLNEADGFKGLCTDLCPGFHTERRCSNGDCERTCENYNAGKSDVCPNTSTKCTVGCDCAAGFYFNSTIGACVPPCEC